MDITDQQVAGIATYNVDNQPIIET